jgi:hypothetical protein
MDILPKLEDIIIFQYRDGKVAVSYSDFLSFLVANGTEPTVGQLDKAIGGRIDAWIVRGANNDNERRT